MVNFSLIIVAIIFLLTLGALRTGCRDTCGDAGGVCVSGSVSEDACSDTVRGRCSAGFTCCAAARVKRSFPQRRASPCGYRPLFPTPSAYRIFGGQNATLGELPWQVYLRDRNYPGYARCGGSVIHQRWVLTAAHCINDLIYLLYAKDLFIVSGLVDINDDNGTRTDGRVQIRRVLRALKSGFANTAVENDIALLELDQPLRFDNFTQPVCLAHSADNFVRSVCKASGWGMQESLMVSEYLKTVDLPVIDLRSCTRIGRRLFHYFAPVTSNFLCTLYAGGGRDTCLGDSGGPLVCLMNSGQFVLAGITSQGIRCGHPHSPAMYTRTAAYYSWIRDKTGLNFP